MLEGAFVRGILARGVLVRGVALLGALMPLVGFGFPASAPAAPSVKIHASFTPERLGRGTTVGFGFDVAVPVGQDPLPLAQLDVRYPAQLGIATSGLGVASCTAATLEALGPKGCPVESLMGHGSALTEIPFGPGILRETASITIVRGPVQNGQASLLFYSEGGTTVDAQVVFTGLLLPAPAPFGGVVSTSLPPIPTLPESFDVALVRLRYTLGPGGLTYYERIHGELVPYHPRGIILPSSCPRGGFPFAASFVFLGGEHTRATTEVPCPRRRRR
jgi:hypothetical protein